MSEESAETGGGDESKRTQEIQQCPDTGRKQGLISRYDIWLCRQSFREKARDIGFKKYD